MQSKLRLEYQQTQITSDEGKPERFFLGFSFENVNVGERIEPGSSIESQQHHT
jgi:hypothetical protein